MSSNYQAYRGRTILTLTLKLDTAMHIGSGFDEISSEADDGEIATIVTDADGEPYVPPTTIKGAMRSLAGAYHSAILVNDVFGAPLVGEQEDAPRKTDSDDEPQPGWLIFSGASYVQPSRAVQNASPPDPKTSSATSTLLAHRTAIDSEFGVAASDKLFQTRMVAPGAVFELRVTVLCDPIDFSHPAVALLIDLLATLKLRGVAMGRGKGDGQGLLKLDAIKSIRRIAIIGRTVKGDAPADVQAWRLRLDGAMQAGRDPAHRRNTLTLACDTPFAVLGSQRKTVSEQPAKGQNNTLRALRRQDGSPDLPGASLMGALRARATWFARIKALRSGLKDQEAEQYVFDRIQPLFGADADTIRFNRDRRKKLTGFAGILKLQRIDSLGSSRRQTMHSVKVDRFSMGPFDSGLFAIEAFEKPTFKVEFYLDRRATQQDREFADAFFTWLASDAPAAGLTLGHAGNRGFGWFKVDDGGVRAWL